MANPNIKATDRDGNPVSGSEVEVNGVVPGSGSGVPVTDDTYVRSEQQSDNSSISAGTNYVIGDTEVEDVLDELDSNLKFTPSETGYYTYEVAAKFRGHSSGDLLKIGFIEDDGSNISALGELSRLVNGTSDVALGPISATFKLDGSNTYWGFAKNNDSSFTIRSPGRLSFYTVRKALVHPPL